MIRTRTTAALAFAAALGAVPALAQTTGPSVPANSSAAPGAATAPGYRAGPGAPGGALGTNTANTPHNPVLTGNDDVRASKVIGSSVYNDRNQKIGSIDDILMNKNHQATEAILSVGGFLGMGSKLVEVPYNQLQFGDTRANSDNRVKLPGATKDSIMGMPDYHYSNG